MPLFRSHVPEWLYEPLPYVYMASGILVPFFLRNFGGALSGLLLLAAGIIIWNMRRAYRSQQRAVAARATEPAPTRAEKASLIQIAWRPEYEVGHVVIDRQHRKLFSIGNDLVNAMIAGESKADIELMLDELLIDIGEHFKSEEEIMASYDCPLSEKHKGIHRALLKRVKDLRERFHQGRLPTGELVGFITYDVIAQHIMAEDLKFSPAEYRT